MSDSDRDHLVKLLRRFDEIREDLARLIGPESEATESDADDDDLRELAATRAAAMRRARGGRP